MFIILDKREQCVPFYARHIFDDFEDACTHKKDAEKQHPELAPYVIFSLCAVTRVSTKDWPKSSAK